MADVTEIDAQGVDAESRWSLAEGLIAAAEIVQAAYGDDFLALLNSPDDMPVEARRDLEALAVALKPVHEIAQRLVPSVEAGETACMAVLGAPRWHHGHVSYARCFHGEWLHRDGTCWGCSGAARKHEYTAGVGCQNPIHWTETDDDTPPVKCSHCLDTEYVALPAPWNAVSGGEDGGALDRLLARARDHWAAWRAAGHPYVDMKGLNAEQARPYEDERYEGFVALFREVIPQGRSELMTLALDPRVWERDAELPTTLAPRDVVTNVLETLIEIHLTALDKEQAAQQQELVEVAP